MKEKTKLKQLCVCYMCLYVYMCVYNIYIINASVCIKSQAHYHKNIISSFSRMKSSFCFYTCFLGKVTSSCFGQFYYFPSCQSSGSLENNLRVLSRVCGCVFMYVSIHTGAFCCHLKHSGFTCSLHSAEES